MICIMQGPGDRDRLPYRAWPEVASTPPFRSGEILQEHDIAEVGAAEESLEIGSSHARCGTGSECVWSLWRGVGVGGEPVAFSGVSGVSGVSVPIRGCPCNISPFAVVSCRTDAVSPSVICYAMRCPAMGKEKMP